jgi:hypothetical protein
MASQVAPRLHFAEEVLLEFQVFPQCVIHD